MVEREEKLGTVNEQDCLKYHMKPFISCKIKKGGIGEAAGTVTVEKQRQICQTQMNLERVSERV